MVRRVSISWAWSTLEHWDSTSQLKDLWTNIVVFGDITGRLFIAKSVCNCLGGCIHIVDDDHNMGLSKNAVRSPPVHHGIPYWFYNKNCDLFDVFSNLRHTQCYIQLLRNPMKYLYSIYLSKLFPWISPLYPIIILVLYQWFSHIWVCKSPLLQKKRKTHEKVISPLQFTSCSQFWFAHITIINHHQTSSTIIHHHSPLQSHYNPIIIRWLSHDIPHILSHLFVFWSGHSAPSPCQATLVDRPCRWTLRCAACCGATCCRDSGGSAMALWAMGWVNIVYTGYMSLGHWW